MTRNTIRDEYGQTSQRTSLLTARESRDDVGCAIEEVELGNGESANNHYHTRHYYSEKSNDVHATDGIKDYVTWTCQALARQRHSARRRFGAEEANYLTVSEKL